MSLALHLWDINADLAARIRTHDFVQGLGNGSLPIENFKRYVAQDAYFLDAFARGYAFCLANGTSREDLYGFAELISGVVEELKLHKSYTERLQIDLSGVTPIAETKFYVEFLLNTARRAARRDHRGMTRHAALRLGSASRSQDCRRADLADWLRPIPIPVSRRLRCGQACSCSCHRHARHPLNYRRAMELDTALRRQPLLGRHSVARHAWTRTSIPLMIDTTWSPRS